MESDPRVSRRAVDGEPRLQLKPNPPATPYQDGAWWPRSTELPVEVSGLIASLSDRLGQVAMVGYHRNAWAEMPPQVQIAGHAVQLQGFTSDEPASVILIGSDGRRITLRVIAPDTSEQIAQRELDSASEPAPGGIPMTSEADLAARSLAEVADRLARHEGGDGQRASEITRWCDEAARQFSNAPVQAFVPILVEHIVRNRMNAQAI